MTGITEEQGTLVAVCPALRKWVDGFFVAKRAQGIAATTVEFYRKRLTHFGAYCQRRTRRIARWTGQVR